MAPDPQTSTPDHEQQDGGPGSHTEDETGGVANDPASGGVSSEADDQAGSGDES